MEYRQDKKSGNKLSVLGMGCMRLPRGVAGIDMLKTEYMILTAFERGINYFDTAYAYGGSEEAIGEIFERNNLRERIHIATKLPHSKCRSIDDVERLFNTSLERLRTDYIDYYLIHNIVTADQWTRLVEMGIEDWIAQKKASGEPRLASTCIGCGACVKKCPQHIDIPERLADVQRRLQPPGLKVALKVAQPFLR